MQELLEDLIHVTFKAKTYLVNTGKIDFWRAQLVRLLNPVADLTLAEKRKSKLFAHSSRNFIFKFMYKDLRVRPFFAIPFTQLGTTL